MVRKTIATGARLRPVSAKRWTTDLVARTRASVAELLAKQTKDFGRDARLRYLAGQVMLMREDPSPLQQLVRFFYALWALELHASEGGLRSNHVSQLARIAQGILEAHGAASEVSRLSFLARELLAATSRILAREGQPWLAAVKQCEASLATRSSVGPEPGAGKLAMAERALRLGGGAQALGAIEAALERGLGESEAQGARILQASILRLCGRFEAAEVLAKTASSVEADWERRKIAAFASGDFVSLQRAVRRGGPHHRLAPLVETTLVSRALDRHLTHEFLPKLAAVVRRRELTWDVADVGFRFARILEDCHDVRRSTDDRVVEVATALEATMRHGTLEHELMGLAAAARWLARMNAFDLAAMALTRYRYLSWALSDGTGCDALGIMADLASKDWMLPPRLAYA